MPTLACVTLTGGSGFTFAELGHAVKVPFRAETLHTLCLRIEKRLEPTAWRDTLLQVEDASLPLLNAYEKETSSNVEARKSWD